MLLKQKCFVPWETSHDVLNVLRTQDAVLTRKVSTNSLARCAAFAHQVHHYQISEYAVMKLLHWQVQTLFFQQGGQWQFSLSAQEAKPFFSLLLCLTQTHTLHTAAHYMLFCPSGIIEVLTPQSACSLPGPCCAASLLYWLWTLPKSITLCSCVSTIIYSTCSSPYLISDYSPYPSPSALMLLFPVISIQLPSHTATFCTFLLFCLV